MCETKIEKHADVPDNFFVLDRHETFGDYARTYGDDLARRYENYDIIYFPHFPLPIDLPMLQSFEIPAAYPKIGTRNGIDADLFVRVEQSLKFDHNHVLFRIFRDEYMTGYLQTQIKSVNACIDSALRVLFPKYYWLFCGNLTWRFTDTPAGDLHIDVFQNGLPLVESDNRLHRIKVFINIDLEPRRWRTSFTLPEILARYRGRLPATLPRDRNVIAHILSKGNLLRDAPAHAVAYPQLSAIAVNAEAVAHQVLGGKRMIAAEYQCEQRDMLDPSKLTHAQVPNWLARHGYQTA
ncbi:MAG: hypothetical protein FJX59_03870 [Alphaproteobacteria bacterium]|nr:hypothetical protein [Alphaproteobacteria bacterium]